MDPVLVALRGSIRASDADRARAVASLRRHYAAGRLETHELEERVEVAYQARWRSELRSLLADMPFEPPFDRADVTHRVAGGVDRFQRALLRLHAICWIVFSVVLLAIWAWNGGEDVWPAIAIVPAAGLLMWHARGSRALSRRLASAADRHGAGPLLGR